jgi:hypothetical protein
MTPTIQQVVLNSIHGVARGTLIRVAHVESVQVTSDTSMSNPESSGSTLKSARLQAEPGSQFGFINYVAQKSSLLGASNRSLPCSGPVLMKLASQDGEVLF